jgi:hypothetical protein
MKIGGGRYADWSIVNPQEQRKTGETEKSPSPEVAETADNVSTPWKSRYLPINCRPFPSGTAVIYGLSYSILPLETWQQNYLLLS